MVATATAIKPFTVAEITVMENVMWAPVYRAHMTPAEQRAAAKLVQRGLILQAKANGRSGYIQYSFVEELALRDSPQQYEAFQDARWNLYHPAPATESAAYVAPQLQPQPIAAEAAPVADEATDRQARQMAELAEIQARHALIDAELATMGLQAPPHAAWPGATYVKTSFGYELAIPLVPAAEAAPIEAPAAPALPVKSIQYDRVTRDFEVKVDGQLVGYAPSYMAGETMATNYVYELLRRRAADETMAAPAADVVVTQVVETPAGDVAVAEVVPAEAAAPADWAAFSCRVCGKDGRAAIHGSGYPAGWHAYEPTDPELEAELAARRGGNVSDVAVREVVLAGESDYCWICGVFRSCPHSVQPTADTTADQLVAWARAAETHGLHSPEAMAIASAVLGEALLPNPPGDWGSDEFPASADEVLPFTPTAADNADL